MDKPKTTHTCVNNLPSDLQGKNIFCVWDYEWDDNRWTKVPKNPKTERFGKSDDISTFSDLNTAAAVQYKHDGIGIKVCDGICAIDIDKCIDDNGNLSDLAKNIVQKMDSYTEKSPSGTGIRILFSGGKRYDTDKYYIKNSAKGLETYIPNMTNRFVTLTGNMLNSCRNIKYRENEFLSILDQYMLRPVSKSSDMPSVTPLTLSDGDLLDKALNSTDSEFKTLWEGKYNTRSQSEADLSLCVKLAFWTGKDPSQIDRLFRQSGLMREKWNRESYRNDTIKKAIGMCTSVYNPQESAFTENDRRGLKKMQESHKQQEEQQQDYISKFRENIFSGAYKPIETGIKRLDYALNGGLIAGTLTLIGAEAGTGKTSLCSQILENLARNGRNCRYINLEMSTDTMLARSISRIIHLQNYQTTKSLTTSDVLQAYKLGDRDTAAVNRAIQYFCDNLQNNLLYDTPSNNDVTDIFDKLKAAAEDDIKNGLHPCDICFDYVQIASGKAGEDEAEVTKRVVKGLKDYAAKYQTIAIGIVATNRESNKSDSASLSSGRGTSTIEYASDQYIQLKAKSNNTVEVYLVKSRFTKADKDNPAAVLNFRGGQSYFDENLSVSEKSSGTYYDAKGHPHTDNRLNR